MKPIHVIVNSHLDPVWLWNRTSGRSAWSNTIRTAVRLMKKHPELPFTCSASALYEWIDETDPVLFADIAELVKAGRWEIVGGWYVQSDVISASAESIRRQAQVAKSYFAEKFGVDVRIGYSVDAFGHDGDLPALLAEAGIDRYVYMRSGETPELFRWISPSGASVVAHHLRCGYCVPPTMNREEFFKLITDAIEGPQPARSFFFGIGDHGGALSEQYLEWMSEAMETYPLRYSTLEQFFEDYAGEDAELPEVHGDLMHIFRGCYSANHRVKQQVAEAESLLLRAEHAGANLPEAWKDVLFCNFHDVLPGTCIREVYERDVYPMLGGAASQALTAVDRAVGRKASRLARQTSRQVFPEGGIYAWNPYDSPQISMISIVGFADPNNSGRLFNAMRNEEGKTIPLQILPSDCSFGPCGMAWGKLTVMLTMAPGEEAVWGYARTDEEFIPLGVAEQESLLKRLEFQVYPDDTGTWGFTLVGYEGHYDTMRLLKREVIADGPVVSLLRATYAYRDSTVVMNLIKRAGLDNIGVQVECDWREHFSALKLGWLPEDRADEFLRQGMLTARTTPMPKSPWMEWRNHRLEEFAFVSEEQPMHDWCALRIKGKLHGWTSADVHGCDVAENALRLTLLRCVPYANHKPFKPNEKCGFLDEGRTTFELGFFRNVEDVNKLMVKSGTVEWCEVSPAAE